YRRFEWQLVFAPPPPPEDMPRPTSVAMPAPPAGPVPAAPPMKMGGKVKRAPAPAEPKVALEKNKDAKKEQKPMEQPAAEAAKPAAAPAPRAARLVAGGRIAADRRGEWDEAARVAAWAPVRVFPAPRYDRGATVGPRTDFRETIFWAPTVRTGKDGTAKV